MKRSKNFYLYRIWTLINKGKSLKDVQEDLKISKQSLNYYIKPLKTLGYIEKVSYGVWKISKQYNENEVQELVKKVKKTTRIGTNQLEEVKDKNEIRGHAFQIKLELPKDFKNWNNRKKIFDMIGLKNEPLEVGGILRGQQAEIIGKRVHFYNKNIVVNLSEEYLFKTAKESKSYALVDFLKVIKKLERMFNNSPLSQYGKYKFKVTRQHYAIIKNALARQYINEEKKLECYSGRGLWLLIDNSFNLEELETVHPETAEQDNEKVHDFFNSLQETEGYTPKKVIEMSGKNADNLNTLMKEQVNYAENIQSHVKAIQQLGAGVKELTKIIKDLKGGKK